MEQFIFACKAKGFSGLFKKKPLWNDFFKQQQNLFNFFSFKLLDELWHDYNVIFYLFNSLVDSIVSVFFGFSSFFIAYYTHLLFYNLFIYYFEGHNFISSGYFVLTLIK